MKKRKAAPGGAAPEAGEPVSGGFEAAPQAAPACESGSPAQLEIPMEPPPSPRDEPSARAGHLKLPDQSSNSKPRRFVLLAASLSLAAGVGGLAGSLSLGLGHLLASAPVAAAPSHSETADDIRFLKDSIAQLRGNVKVLSDHVAAVRAGLSASTSSSAAQLAKLADAIEKLDRSQGEHRGAAAASPETTGSTAAAAEPAPAKAAVVDGWVLRKATRGAALVEGRYGVVEIEPGDHLPGVGRVEQIKRQDGRWVVVTPKGLILPVQ